MRSSLRRIVTPFAGKSGGFAEFTVKGFTEFTVKPAGRQPALCRRPLAVLRHLA
jgi:hypothetical protein